MPKQTKKPALSKNKEQKNSQKTKKKIIKKQNVVLMNFPVNSGFDQKVKKILNNKENYIIEDSPFDLSSKSSVYAQACTIGLNWMLDHPKSAPTDDETNLFAQAVGKTLFPKIDARLRTLFEATIANYINNKSTNLYVKNILLALAQKFGETITGVSINQLTAPINRNIDYVTEAEKKHLLKNQTPLKVSKKVLEEVEQEDVAAAKQKALENYTKKKLEKEEPEEEVQDEE